MPGSVRIAFWAAMVAWGSACSARGPGFAPAPSEPQTPPPAPPVVQGPLAVKIVYPPNDSAPAVPGKSLIVHAREGYAVQARDSTFIFGTVGRGDAVTGTMALTTDSTGAATVDNGTLNVDLTTSSVGGDLSITSGALAGITDSGTVTVGGNLTAITDANAGVIDMGSLAVTGTSNAECVVHHD